MLYILSGALTPSIPKLIFNIFFEADTKLILNDSLLLNRIAMDVESGMSERISEANRILVLITNEDNISMQSIKFVIEMIIEHGKILAEGIVPLERWYRKNDNNSLNSKLVKATIESSRGNYLQAAREYQDAAKKSQHDFEKYA